MTLDLTALRKAIAQLEEALSYASGDAAQADERLALHLRAGAIQAFEFTYELAFKTLKRFLRLAESDPGAVDDLSFNQVIRRAYDLGLLKADLATWQGFRRDRGTTSHAYDEAHARSVFRSIPAFLAEIRFLTAQLQTRDGVV